MQKKQVAERERILLLGGLQNQLEVLTNLMIKNDEDDAANEKWSTQKPEHEFWNKENRAETSADLLKILHTYLWQKDYSIACQHIGPFLGALKDAPRP